MNDETETDLETKTDCPIAEPTRDEKIEYLSALVKDLQREVSFLRECVSRMSAYTKNTGMLTYDGGFTIRIDPVTGREIGGYGNDTRAR